jgi:hypothetical protein
MSPRPILPPVELRSRLGLVDLGSHDQAKVWDRYQRGSVNSDVCAWKKSMNVKCPRRTNVDATTTMHGWINEQEVDEA